MASPKLYGSVSNKATRATRLYGPVSGLAEPVTKLYGSVNGKARLIHQEFGHAGPLGLYGYLVCYDEMFYGETYIVLLNSQAEVDALVPGYSSRLPYRIKEVYLTNQVTSLPTNFLYCNGQVSAEVDTVDISSASITSIPDNFLAGQSSLVSFAGFPAGVTTIGDSFMAGCLNFNQPLSLPSGLTQIGKDFMYDCTTFNQALSLPSGLTHIGSGFLAVCAAFNQNLSLPSSLTSIGEATTPNSAYFMSDPWDMCSSIDVGNLSPSILVWGGGATEDLRSLSQYGSPTGPYYVTGITIAGTNRAAWLSALTNIDGEDSLYRKLINAGY